MDQYPVRGGVVILLGMPDAKETGISSGRLGLWLVCVFTFSATMKFCFFFQLKNCTTDEFYCYRMLEETGISPVPLKLASLTFKNL